MYSPDYDSILTLSSRKFQPGRYEKGPRKNFKWYPSALYIDTHVLIQHTGQCFFFCITHIGRPEKHEH